MKLCLVGHSHRYAMEQAIVALLGQKAVLSEEIAAHEEDDWLVAGLSYDDTCAIAKAELQWNGVRYIETASTAVSDLREEDDRVRLEQHVLKLAVFKAVQKATGEKYPWGSLTGMRPSKLALRMLERGATPEMAQKQLIDHYLLEPVRAKLVVEAAMYGKETKRQLSPNEISLYVGIPFCPTRCAYCSFVSSETGKSGHLIEPYLERLLEEIRIRGALVQELGFKISTVYIGGGTPTSLNASQLDRLMDSLHHAFPLNDLLEYTVEAGRPDTITLEKLKVLKRNGADRISINPQSMVEDVLKRSARPHTPEDIRIAYEQARSVGFDCINMDTIAGLPGDTSAGFRSTLEELAAMRPENITVHTLALKNGAELKKEGSGSSSRDVMAMLDFSIDLLYNNGYNPYYLYRQKYMAASLENTGWTLAGKESLYNICIMEEFQTILSLGAGGVTKLVGSDGKRIERIANNKFPMEYIGSAQKILADGEKIRNFYSNTLEQA